VSHTSQFFARGNYYDCTLPLLLKKLAQKTFTKP